MNVARTLGLTAALCAIVALGNVRQPSSDEVELTSGDARNELRTTQVSLESDPMMQGGDIDGPADIKNRVGNDDDVHLAPAVFAKDPAVQLIFSGHLSKWM